MCGDLFKHMTNIYWTGDATMHLIPEGFSPPHRRDVNKLMSLVLPSNQETNKYFHLQV